MAYSEAYQLLANGSIVKAADSSYSAAMGDWWIIMLFVTFLIAIQLITKEEGATGIFGLLGSAAMLKYIPQGAPVYIQGILYLILSLSIAMVLYRAFKPKE